MALKAKLTAFEFAALNPALQTEYKLASDGSYSIDLGGMFVTDKDPAGLFSALESERQQHAATKTHLTRLETEAADAKRAVELAEAQKKGDTEALKKLFDDERARLKADYDAQVAERQKAIETARKQAAEQLRQTEATRVAAEIFGTKAPIMLPHVLNSISVTEGENPTIAYLGADGKPNPIATADSFKNSFLTNPLFKDMVVVSHASGGSANDGNGNVPATRKSDGSARTYDDYKPGELMALKQSNPELFSTLRNAKFPKTS